MLKAANYKIKKQYFQNFKEIAKKTSIARKAFNDQFSIKFTKFIFRLFKILDTFTNFLLPEYEKNCVSEYLDGNNEKLIFLNNSDDTTSQSLKDLVLVELNYFLNQYRKKILR